MTATRARSLLALHSLFLMSHPPTLADRLRAGAHAALGRHAYGAATFFAEQLAALPGEKREREREGREGDQRVKRRR